MCAGVPASAAVTPSRATVDCSSLGDPVAMAPPSGDEAVDA